MNKARGNWFYNIFKKFFSLDVENLGSADFTLRKAILENLV